MDLWDDLVHTFDLFSKSQKCREWLIGIDHVRAVAWARILLAEATAVAWFHLSKETLPLLTYFRKVWIWVLASFMNRLLKLPKLELVIKLISNNPHDFCAADRGSIQRTKEFASFHVLSMRIYEVFRHTTQFLFCCCHCLRINTLRDGNLVRSVGVQQCNSSIKTV